MRVTVKEFHKFRFLSLMALLSLLVWPGAVSASDCAPFPRLKIWGEYTHEKVRSLIEQRLGGKWDGYLEKLDKSLEQMQAIHERGKGVALNIGGKRYALEGKTLEAYIKASEQRRDVVACLAQEAEIAKLDNFATAAGGEASDVEVAAIQVADLNLNVDGECRDGVATFKVSNQGETWPKLATIAIYRVGNGAPKRISARRMRLSNGQMATFKVPPTKNTTGRLGLFVEPSWVKRKFAFDATLTCG